MNFIAFSRKLGSGGTEVARKAADQLGYNFYDTDAIEQVAREMGFLESVREIDEKAPSLFRRFFSQKPTVDLERLSSVVYELARRGNAVFLGRGSQILLRSFNCSLNVRVTASRETRIRNLVARGYHEEAAAAALDRSDHERGAFIRFAFGVDWDTPELYDIVLNMDKLTVELAVNTVINLASSEAIQACSVDALRSIECMALLHRAEAAILEAELAYGQPGAVSVTVLEPGHVELTGYVGSEVTRTRAEEVVRAVRGVEAVQNRIRVVPADRFA